MIFSTDREVKQYWIGSHARSIAIGSFILALLALWEQIKRPESGALLVTCIFGVAGLFLYALSDAYIVMTDQYIMYKIRYGFRKEIYRLDWHNVKSVITDGTTFGFIGDDKYLVVSVAMANRLSRKNVLEILNGFFQEKNVPVSFYNSSIHSSYIPRKQINTRVETS